MGSMRWSLTTIQRFRKNQPRLSRRASISRRAQSGRAARHAVSEPQPRSRRGRNPRRRAVLLLPGLAVPAQSRRPRRDPRRARHFDMRRVLPWVEARIRRKRGNAGHARLDATNPNGEAIGHTRARRTSSNSLRSCACPSSLSRSRMIGSPQTAPSHICAQNSATQRWIRGRTPRRAPRDRRRFLAVDAPIRSPVCAFKRNPLCATDPPYLVDYDGTSHPQSSEREKRLGRGR